MAAGLFPGRSERQGSGSMKRERNPRENDTLEENKQNEEGQVSAHSLSNTSISGMGMGGK